MHMLVLDSRLGSVRVRTVLVARVISVDCCYGVCVMHGLVTRQGRLHCGTGSRPVKTSTRRVHGGGVPMFLSCTFICQSCPGVQSVHVSAGRVITGEEAQGRMITLCLSVGAGL